MKEGAETRRSQLLSAVWCYCQFLPSHFYRRFLSSSFIACFIDCRLLLSLIFNNLPNADRSNLFCLEDLWACFFMNASITAIAKDRFWIGNVDDGVHLHIQNIVSNNVKRHYTTTYFIPKLSIRSL